MKHSVIESAITVSLMMCALLIMPYVPAEAQSASGIVSGAVIDSATGEALVGAVVKIEETKLGAVCDLDGAYRIANIPVGVYAVSATLVGYTTTRITDVAVKGGEVTKLDIVLSTDAVEVDEVVVKAQAVRNTEAVLLKDRQKAEAVSDAVSSEAISRAGSSDAADAMKQVTGASVVDGKQVVVRGLGDRYTSVLLNGSELPSANPYQRSASMDLFPANLLDNIKTVKTFTPDKPGNFSGGTVNVETKSFPDKLTLSLSASGAGDMGTALSDGFLTYGGGDTDWLGKDDGSRDIPDALRSKDSVIPDVGSAFSDIGKAETLDSLTRSFNPQMRPSSMTAPLNQSYSFSLGNQIGFLGRPLGVVGSLSYSRNYSSYVDGVSGRWSLTGKKSETSTLNNDYNLRDARSTDDVLWGGLLNVSYKLNPRHVLGVNYVHNRNGENAVRFLSGSFPYDLDEDAVYETSVLQYSERLLRTLQMTGGHSFERFLGARVDWKASLSDAKQDQPDLRYFTDSYIEIERYDDEGNPFTRRIYKIKDNQPPSRYYRYMDEDHGEYTLDVTLPLKSLAGRDGSVKVGGLYSSKERDFSERLFTFKQNPTYKYNGEPVELFADGNIGLIDSTRVPYGMGLFVLETFQPSSNYVGEQTVAAGYGMIDVKLVDRLRFIGGARYETTDMKVANIDTSGALDTRDILPSVNLVYELRGDMNLRAAYGRTLARPSFREMAPYASFDFWGDFIYLGNPGLKRTLIDNYDLRWEWFVRPGELYAVSAFVKIFDNPIERVIENINGEIRFRNVGEARVRGLEFEVRKRLDTFSSRLGDFQIGGNMSIVDSRVDISASELRMMRAFDPKAKSTREFQGQSPYIINIDLTYDNADRGVVSSLYYNVFGERLAEISLGGTPDVYEQPFHTLNYSLSKNLTQRVSLKFSAKNLMDSTSKKVHSYKGKDYVYSSYKKGRSVSLGLGYRI